MGQKNKSPVKANLGLFIERFVSKLQLQYEEAIKAKHSGVLNAMFSWPHVSLAGCVDPRMTVAVKSLATSQVGRRGRRHGISKGGHWGEGSRGLPGSIVMIQQRKKVLESQTVPEETGKHSVFFMSLKAGIWRMQ